MQPPVTAENEIEIDIDTKNEGWCTAIDWAENRKITETSRTQKRWTKC